MLRKFFALFFSLSVGAASAQALYVLIAPTPATKIGCWAPHFQKYDTIIGYSSLGHFFLRASTDSEYIVLYPLRKAAKSYGLFKTVTAFENEVLKEPGFSSYVLRSDHVAAIRARVGSLKKEEVYIPRPYPFLGGSEKPETYNKGDVWVFMEIVAQLQGLCSQ